MKNGSVDYNYFGHNLVFMLYDETRDIFIGLDRQRRADSRFMQIRTELLSAVGCLDSELI
jgi:hypothetical protein